MTDILDYAAPNTKPYTPGIGYWLILAVNVLSLGAILWNLPSFGLFGSSVGQGIIGDAYGPMIGIVIGIPYTLSQLLIGTIPAIAYWSKFTGTGKLRVIALPFLISIVALFASGALTVACILAPHTHGSGC